MLIHYQDMWDAPDQVTINSRVKLAIKRFDLKQHTPWKTRFCTFEKMSPLRNAVDVYISKLDNFYAIPDGNLLAKCGLRRGTTHR